MVIQPGATLGSYSILEQLGRGGMAAVYKAYHQRLDRYVAIKVMLSAISQDEGFQERFQQEARAVARLNHPNIITIHDYGEQQGLSYLVTELIEGGTLADRLGGPLDPALAARILGPIASALDYAHDRGILHRDVKPSNILLRLDESPVLSDFGIAKLNDSSQHMTRTGLIMGTPAYQAPEQASGEPASSATDQYALGVVGYELLTGRVPYSADTPMAVLLAHLVKPLPPPRLINPSLSPELEAAVVRALSKDPHDRFSSVTAFAMALAEAVDGGTAAAGWPFVTTSPFGAPKTPSRPVTAPGLQPRPTPAPTPLPSSTPGVSGPAASPSDVVAPSPASRLDAPPATPARPYTPPPRADTPRTSSVVDHATVIEQTPIPEQLSSPPTPPGLEAPEAAGSGQGQASPETTTMASLAMPKSNDASSAPAESPPTRDSAAGRGTDQRPPSSEDRSGRGHVGETPTSAPPDGQPRAAASGTPAQRMDPPFVPAPPYAPSPISTPPPATTPPPTYNPPVEHNPPAAHQPAPSFTPAAAFQPAPSYAPAPTSTPAPTSVPAGGPARSEDRGSGGLSTPPVAAAAAAPVESPPSNGVGTAGQPRARETPTRDERARAGMAEMAPSVAPSPKSTVDYAPATQISSVVPASVKQPTKKAAPGGTSRLPIAIAGGIAVVVLVGAVAAVNVMGRGTASPTAVPMAAPTLAPARALIATAAASLPTVGAAATTAISALAPTAIPTDVPTALPTEAPTALPTSEPTPAPTVASAAASTPTEAQAWAATSDGLNGVWGSDWPKAIAALDAFHAQHPAFAPATEKLYAALLSYGDQLAKSGDKAGAVTQYQQAKALLPDRTEATAALTALTPTPAAPPTSLPAPQPTPTPTPVPIVRQPPVQQPPTQQPPVQQPPPTRTGPRPGFTPT